MERVPNRSDAGRRSQSRRQAHSATDAVGLVPWSAKDIKVSFLSINARAETVGTAPAFRDAWKKGQRCLVITDGFYEWKKPEKQPYAVAMADKSHMVMAGLWDEWTDKKTGERIKKALLVPFKDDALTKWPVSRQKIGNVRNKDREVASPEVLA